MQITPYSWIHLGIADLCLFMAVMHLAIYWLSRTRAQIWMALTYFGWGLLSAGLAGSSLGAKGALGPPEPWIYLGHSSALVMWFLLRAGWEVLGCQVAGWRRAVLWVFTVEGIFWMVWIVFATATRHPPTYEAALALAPLPILVMHGAFAALTALVFMFEGVLAIRRGQVLGWYLLAAIALLAPFMNWEFARALGFTGGPSPFGLIGLPVIGFASAALVAMSAKNIRQSRELEEEIDRYRVLRPLAKGGMGELFLATRTGPGGFHRQVALKRMLRGERESERFFAEARMAGALQHPNIVAVYDVGRTRDGWFIVMEYLEGVTLSTVRDHCRITGTPIPAEVVAAIGLRIGLGLAHAHAAGIVHRDVSPHNVMVTYDGALKLLDFGIAKERTGSELPGDPTALPVHPGEETMTGHVLGKMPYLAPERLGGGAATAASDLYSLGILLYELCSGRRPYQRDDIDQSKAEALMLLMKTAPVPLTALRPDLPPKLAQAIERAIAWEPNERPGGAGELAQDLRAVLASLPQVDLAAWLHGLIPHAGDAHYCPPGIPAKEEQRARG